VLRRVEHPVKLNSQRAISVKKSVVGICFNFKMILCLDNGFKKKYFTKEAKLVIYPVISACSGFDLYLNGREKQAPNS